MLRKWKKRLYRCLWVVAILLAVLGISRNWLTRWGIQSFASSYLGCPVKVDNVFLGWNVLQITGLEVHLPMTQSADTTTPNVRVGCIRIVPSLRAGIQEGIWADQLTVTDPQLDLDFDTAGALVTTFPLMASDPSSPSSAKVPVREVVIQRAQLKIKQPAKTEVCLVADHIQAKFSDNLHLMIRVADFLGGQIEIGSTIDLKTLSGQTRIVAGTIQLDTKQLADWPLIPAQINQERLQAVASLDVTLEHPADQTDLRLHDAIARATLDQIRCTALPPSPFKVDCHFQNQQGIAVASLRSQPLGGNIEWTANADLFAETPSVTTHYELSNLQLELLGPWLSRQAKMVLPPYTTHLTTTGDARLYQHASQWALHSSISVGIHNNSVASIPVGDVRSNWRLNAALPRQENAIPICQISGGYQWDGVRLDSISEQLVGLPLAGQVTSHGELTLPFSWQPNLQALSTLLQLNWSGIGINGLSISDSMLYFSARQGGASLQLQPTTIIAADGQSLGQVSLQAVSGLTATDQIEATFTATDFSLPAAALLIGAQEKDLDGSVSVEVVARSALGTSLEPESWNSDIQVASTRLRFQQEALEPIRLQAKLRSGNFEVPDFEIRWRNALCRLAAAGTVRGEPTLNGQMSITDAPLSDLALAARPYSSTELALAGTASVTGGFQLKMMPWKLEAGGQLQVKDTVFRRTRVGDAQLDWSANLKKLTLSSGSDDFFGGRYQVAAELQDLDWTRTTVQARCQDLQVARLVSLAGLELGATGTLAAAAQLGSIENLSTLVASGSLNTQGVSIYRLPLEIAEATLAVREGLATLSSRGQISGGDFQIESQTDLVALSDQIATGTMTPTQLPVDFQARLDNLTISSLANHLRLPRELQTIQGTFSGTCLRDPATREAGMLCQIDAAMEKISFNRIQLSPRIAGELKVGPDRINLTNFSGRVADGRLTGSADVTLGAVPRGQFQLQLTHVNLRRAAASLGTAGKGISGDASLGIRGRIGNTLSGDMNLKVSHAVASDLMVQQVSIPLDWSYSQSAKSFKWRCRNGVIETGNGKVHLTTGGSFNRTLNAQLAARLERIDSSKLIRGKSFGAGNVSGTVSLKAQRARDLKQVSGNFDIQLSQIQAMEMPVLDQLPSMIQLPSVSPSAVAQENGGQFQGRIANGLVYVDDSYVSQSNIHVLLNGRATLDGNLNFDVTASTQQSGPMDDLLALADSPLMLAGPAPVAMLAKANEAMKNRVVHVQLTGNASRPILRLQPGKQLSQEALRFFIRSSLPTQFANLAERSTSPRHR